MDIIAQVFFAVFSVIGVWTVVVELMRFVSDEKSEGVYVYFSEDHSADGRWDVYVASPEEERIIQALAKEYEKVYIQREADRWTQKESTSKEQ